MSEKKPIPLVPTRGGIDCPVCGKKAYSKGGIHPQCAVLQADAARSEQIKQDRKRDANVEKTTSWNKKKCPKCGSESHVRRKTCDCGHSFF